MDNDADNRVVAAHALQVVHHLNGTRQCVTLRWVLTNQISTLQHAFSSQLINAAPPPDDADADNVTDIRVSIMQFLLKSLQVSGHNLSLMLLAFSEQSAARDQLQVEDSVLSAILALCLEPDYCHRSPALAECCPTRAWASASSTLPRPRAPPSSWRLRVRMLCRKCGTR